MDESFDGEINWPKSFKPILKGGSKYFVIDESFLLALGVKVHTTVTLHGFTSENSEKLGNFFTCNVFIYQLIKAKKKKKTSTQTNKIAHNYIRR